jgi:hypothetical protein
MLSDFMRDLLTYIGIGLILVLCALLGAPYAIDFDAHRARFAEEISRVTGAQTRLEGRIALRVLPTPYFSAENLSLKGELGALKAKKAEFELSLPALLQGGVVFTSAELSHFTLDVDGDLLRRPPHLSAGFENLVLRDGSLRVTHAGTPFLALEGVDFTGKAPNLDGPYDGRGAFRFRDRTIGYSFSSDAFAGTRLPLKLKVTGPDDLGRLALDGALDLGGVPSFSGKAAAEGVVASQPPSPRATAGGPTTGPWRAGGEIAAQPGGIRIDKAALHLGEGATSAKFSGSADYGVASGALSVNLSAPVVEAPWADVVIGAVARGIERAAPTSLRLQIDELGWRGPWVRVKLARDPGGPLQIAADGAGESHLDIAAAPDAQKIWRGKGEFSANDYQAFAAASGAPALPFQQVAASGPFSLSAGPGGSVGASWGAFALSDGKITLDRAKFTGDLAWTAAEKGARAKLTAKLAGSGLDPDMAQDYGAALGDADLDLTLDAQTTGKAEGRLALRLLRDKGLSRLEKLEAKNLAGADVSASGAWKSGFADLKGTLRLKAGELADFAALAARLAPGQTTQLLASRAKILSPASLTAKAENGGYAFDGQAAATKFSFALDAQGGIAADISAPEAFDLLAQLGAPPLLSPQKLGPGQISLKTQSQGERRDVTGKAALGRINGQFDGVLRAGGLEGALSLAGDPSGLIGGPSGSGKIDGQVEAHDGRVVLREIAGERGDARFTGQLALSADGVSGELDVDKVSAPALLAMTLGAPAPVKKGDLWPSLSFAPVLIDPPHVKLLIRAAEVAPFGGPAKFDLTLGPNALKVTNIEAPAGGGMVRGGFDLRRQAGQATLSGELTGEDLALKNPALSAKVGGKIKFAGSGASMAALVGSLSGTGSASVADLTVAGLALEAPDQVLAAQAEAEAPFNAKETLRALDRALASADLHVADGETPLRLAKGVASAERDAIAFSYDLNDLTFALTAPLRDRLAELNVSGAWSAPARKLDADAFVSIAATKALEREQARIARQRELDRQRKAELARQKQEELERRKQAEREQRLQHTQQQPAAESPAQPPAPPAKDEAPPAPQP